MNWEQLEGNWKQMTGEVRKRWGNLTDDDLAQANGNRDLLTGRIQERYGIAKEQAQAELDRFINESPDAVATEGDPVDIETLKKGM